MNKKILLTGVTGNVGLEVAAALSKSGEPFVAAVRNVEKAKKALGSHMEFSEFNFERPDTYEKALKGTSSLFLVRPPAISDAKRYINPVIDCAKAAGVEHIVFLSLLGAENNPVVPHYKVEKHILHSGIPYTFLRASFFMQNLTDFFRGFIKEENILFAPAGSGRTSFIDCRDIGEVGALSLLDKNHRNKAYPLTGKESLNYYEIADMMTKELGRKITYTNPSGREFRKRLIEKGYDKTFVTVLTGIFLTAKFGFAKKVTGDTALILGRPPVTIEQFIRDYRQSWC